MDFEHTATTYDVIVWYYHTDNGRFLDDIFLNTCIASNQTIDFCRVEIYFQNGIAEINIGFLQDLTHSILLHTMYNWPEMISLELWPLAL